MSRKLGSSGSSASRRGFILGVSELFIACNTLFIVCLFCLLGW